MFLTNIIPHQPYQNETDLFYLMLHLKNTISLKLFLILSWQLWLHINGKRFEEPGMQKKIQFEILHIPTWKLPQLPYSKVNVAVKNARMVFAME